MPLTREQKAAEVASVADRLSDCTAVYLTNYEGLDVEQVNDLRRRFRASGVEYKVVKNTLLKRAMEGIGGYDGLYEYLKGPTAVAISTEPAAAARVIKAFVSDTRLERPSLKAAYVDGAVFGSDQIDVLALLKSKEELVGDVIGLLLSPIQTIMGALTAPGSNVAAILETLQERSG